MLRRMAMAGVTRPSVVSHYIGRMILLAALVVVLGPAGAYANALRVGVAFNPSGFDPQTGTSGFEHPILYSMYDTLIEFEPQALTPKPGLAKAWRFTNPTTLVLDLEQGVKFHDGTPFDANAVKFNLDRALTYEKSLLKPDIESIESVKVLGHYQVQVNLKKPDAALVLILADRPGMMVSPTAARNASLDLARTPVGTGPFKFSDWKTGDRVVVVKNPDYWKKGTPQVDQIVWKILTDENTMVNALLSGELDFIYNFSPKDIERLKGTRGITVSQSPTLLFQALYLNRKQGPLTDKRVRQALAAGIDRESLVKGAQYGVGTAASQLVPPEHWAFQKDLDKLVTYDPARAKALLKEAGQEGLKLSCWVPARPDDIRRGEILKDQLAKIGVDLTVTPLEATQGIQQFWREQKFDAMAWTWSGRPDPSQTYQLLLGATSFFNLGDSAPDVQELIAKTRQGTTLAARQAAFRDLVRRGLIEDVQVIPLFFGVDLAAFKGVKGYVPNLLGKPRLMNVQLE